jgi:hypothetical protein
MRLPLWIDVDWDYEDGEIYVKSVRVFENEILPHLTRWELDQIRSNCMAKQKEIWAEERS